MTLAEVKEDVVLAELWVSLVSLIESYVAAHELGKAQAGSTVYQAGADGGEVTIRRNGRTISLTCKKGLGEWRSYHESAVDRSGRERRTGPVAGKGTFRMGTDGMVEFGDRKGKLDMDIAAIAFTARVLDED